MDSPDRSRRAVLLGRLPPQRAALRPPWAVAESIFIDACTRCGDCVAACPEHILAPSAGGFPQVDFRLGACTFCGACATACSAGAIVRVEERQPWDIRAAIGESCLTRNKVACQNCRDSCAEGAIGFAYNGGVAQPQIDLTRCTGCGACVSVCPVAAVSVAPIAGTHR